MQIQGHNAEIASLQQEVELQNQKNELTNMIESEITDEFIEKIAREKLGLVKPSERIFINSGG